MKQHTEGEWLASRLATPDYCPHYGIHNGGNDFCIVKGDNAFADAQLIAAAPKLLEALKFIADQIEQFLDDEALYIDSEVGERLSALSVKASKAIDEATGEV